ncbi:tRNA dihydrouridine synthase [Leeia oryzae]|uniref:tRNA dihydrouridine synthase n=1 Tax=Leeia oryzae TaxID=356662 RepID=UPI000374D2B2|nr:tRNA-dihydrouridine synthase [Leeia oryzae]
MRIVFAPMEGVADHLMRDQMTRLSDVDWCVTEFMRVTDTLLPPRHFYRVMPELKNGSKTPAGVPVRAQLLGSDPVCMAENAARVAELGSPAVDLNFGCPAKIVNRHRGGAVLLDEPDVLYDIVSTVRRAVPAATPVTAKMRLGVKDTALTLDCAAALESAGVSELVVHARTKVDGYKPPAHWEWIARIADHIHIPVIANGEIWSADDYVRCKQVSGLADVMIGRGLLSRPDLAWQIRRRMGGQTSDRSSVYWPDLIPVFEDYFRQICAKVEPKHAAGRFKQWVGYLRKGYPEANAFFMDIRTLSKPADIFQYMSRQRLETSEVALSE